MAGRLTKYDPRALGADCDNCPLKGSPVVPPTPPTKKPTAILVGEAPGAEEVYSRACLVGPKGRRVNKTLEKNKLDRDSMHLTTAVLCRIRTEEDRKKAFKCCAPRLLKEIDSYDKSVPVVPLGADSFKSVMGKKLGISLARGFLWEKDGRDVLPTLDPYFVMRDHILSPLFTRDFKRIAKRIREGKLEVERPKGVSVPRTLGELNRLLARFGNVVACDIETTEASPTVNELLCIGLSDVKTTIVIPWNEKFKDALNKFFSTRTIIGHNFFAFDSIVLARFGVSVPKIEDTLIAHHIYASHFPQRLDHLVSFYLDSSPWKVNFGKRGSSEKGLPKKLEDPDQLYMYNALDAYLTARLWQEMREDLLPWLKLYKEDKELAELCRDMQQNGVLVDVPLKEDLSRRIKEKEERLSSELKELNGGEDVAVNKVAQIRQILFEKFKAPIIERTPKGLPSTSKNTLRAFASQKDRPYAEFSKRLILLRGCMKMRVTYLDRLPVEKDGRVRSSWRSFGTPTGRFASRGPNLMNIRRMEDKEPEQQIRDIYIAPEGESLVGFDLSQVEPRVCAYIAADPVMIAAINTGDYHSANARIIFGDLPEIRDYKTNILGKNLRMVAKTAGLGLGYGAGAEKLFETIRSSPNTANFPVKYGQVVVFLEKLHKAYKVHFDRVERDVETCRRQGHLKIGFRSGRIRWFGHAPSPTDCANSPIQAGAADIMNDLLLRIWRRLKKTYGSVVKLVAQIHDAGIFQCPDRLVPAVRAIIQEEADKPVMINGFSVVFPIDLKSGKRWSEV